MSISRSHRLFPKIVFSFSEDLLFFLANSVDPDEMPHNVAFHLGLNCLSKYAFNVKQQA